MASSPTTLDETPKKCGSEQDETTLGLSAPVVIDDLETTSRFSGAGVDFKGKLIGVEEVCEARGDKMCQVAMAKLKAGVKATGDHKQRVTINISLDGVKIIDEKTSEILHSHEVKKISFIARDSGDSRAFGYVYRAKETSHQFFGVKTEKAAEGLVLSLRDLFQTVYEIKKKKMTDIKSETDEKPSTTTDEKIETDKPSEDGKCTNGDKASGEIGDILLDIDLGGSLQLKDTSSTTLNSANGSLSPMSAFFDPWGPSYASVNVQLSQQTHSMLFDAAASPHSHGSSQYQQNVYPPTGNATSLMMTSPYQSSGNTFIASPMTNPAFPIYSGAPSGVTTPNFPPTVAWPTTLGPPSATGGVLASHQRAPAVFPSATSSGVTAPFPGLNQNTLPPAVAAATVRDPFAPLTFQPHGGPVPLVPERRISPSNPFTTPLPLGAARSSADPFAEFAVVIGGGQTTGSTAVSSGLPHPPGKKTDRKDFFQETPKPPSLFDLTQQQQQPTIAVHDIFASTQFSNGAPIHDPFA